MHPSRSRLFASAFFALGLTLLWVGHDPSAGEPKKNDQAKPLVLPPVFSREQPESVEDLKAIEDHVQAVLPKILPAVVGVRMGPAQGSGVIVDKEGHVLTAGHVSGNPDRAATILLPNAKQLKAKSLGRNGGIDSGMILISDKGEYPFVELGKSSNLKKGEWVIAIGHPGGFRPNRTPVVRVGRVLMATPFLIRTDCVLVGGDSGGPLFDMNGRLIGIHSRIGNNIAENIHVPVDSYRKDWDRLAKGESFGGQLGQQTVVKSGGGKIVFEKRGELSARDPRDAKQKDAFAQTHVFKMVPGFTYTIDMIMRGSGQLDPFLRLEDSTGKELASDDDGAGSPNARIVFRPTKVDEYRIITTSFEPSQVGSYTLVIRQSDPKLLAGKIDVVAALHIHRQVILAEVDKFGKLGGKLYTGGYLFDDKGKPVVGKTVEFKWTSGKAQVKSDNEGAIRLPLSKQNVKGLTLDVPEGLKLSLDLTDQAGNVLNVNPDLDKPKKKSGGGTNVFQVEGVLTEKDPVDKVRNKGCVFKVHTFKMTPGSTYTIDLESSDFDAYLRLEDPTGKLVAEDDDSLGTLNSRIVVTPETEGLYRLIVTTCDPDQTGVYRLTIYQAEGKKTNSNEK